MGGDSTPTDSCNSYITEESSLDQNYPENSLDSPSSLRNLCNGGDEFGARAENEEVGLVLQDFEKFFRASSRSMDEVNQKRVRNVYMDVLKSYDELHLHKDNLQEAKSKILSYNPGSWIEEVGGMKMDDYNIPENMTLLLVGPKGSGKSSLVNKISRVFEEDPFAPERAQVSYSSVGDGTCFLQEYTIPRGSNSFSLYDTRGLSDDLTENKKLVKHWMKKGVRHGELITRDSDDHEHLKSKARQNANYSIESKGVNFVIFVVSAVSILQSMDSYDETKKRQTQAVATTFNNPLLSFKNDKPAVVLTHGDLLSLSDRTRVRLYMGQLLGIHPRKQIFDIPESDDSGTQLSILNMLRYCLEHADKHLPLKDILPVEAPSRIKGGCTGWEMLAYHINEDILPALVLIWTVLLFIFILMSWRSNLNTNRSATTIDSLPNIQPEVLQPQVNIGDHSSEIGSVRSLQPEASRSDVKIEWGSIRHLWFDGV